jgi:hypothetical protein
MRAKGILKHPLRLSSLVALGWLAMYSAYADCTTTNLGITPLNDLGFGIYKMAVGGLYPGGANSRPALHEVAGQRLARNQILPRNFNGVVDTNNGKIVLLSIGMSNTTQEWAAKGRDNFRNLANRDPSKNPRLLIVDGAQGGQDAAQWTNYFAVTWSNVLQRLVTNGANAYQVQVLWLKQALANPRIYGAFPAHAEALREDLELILRVAKQRFPNLALAYVSSRTRAYTNGLAGLNPEVFAFESGCAVRWLLERQLRGQLNYDPAQGQAVAPWMAWGPYLWADGTTPRSDGFTWLCADLENDFTHPSTNGVAKVARQLLAFFKTDPTARPWFLKQTVTGLPSLLPVSFDRTNGLMPLTVHFLASPSDPDGQINDIQWTFSDGTFATQTNVVKRFPAPGLYFAHATVTDNSGNTTSRDYPINVTTTLALWKQAKFTVGELGDPSITGDAADADADGVSNELEYALGLEPKMPNAAATGLPRAAIENGYFTLTFTRYRPASDVTLIVEGSDDLVTWQSEGVGQSIAVEVTGTTETLRWQSNVPVVSTSKGFFRL